jgi:hypothetical protein
MREQQQIVDAERCGEAAVVVVRPMEQHLEHNIPGRARTFPSASPRARNLPYSIQLLQLLWSCSIKISDCAHQMALIAMRDCQSQIFLYYSSYSTARHAQRHRKYKKSLSPSGTRLHTAAHSSFHRPALTFHTPVSAQAPWCRFHA